MDKDTITIFTLAGGFSVVIAALVSGIFGLINRRGTDSNSLAIEKLKSELSEGSERSKAQLEHGQVISSTQWNTEFNAYRELWKTVVPVVTLADRLVFIDEDLAEIGLEQNDLLEEHMNGRVLGVLQKFTSALTDCLHAIHEYAPFYPADIRKNAGEMHKLGKQIHRTHMIAMVARQKGQLPAMDADAGDQQKQELFRLLESIDGLEELIRKRLASVQVLNPLTA